MGSDKQQQMKIRISLILLVIFSVSTGISFAQNRLTSRLFYQHPSLFYSKTQISNFNLSEYDIEVAEPIDQRKNYYGEIAYKNKRVMRLDEFFSSPAMTEIQRKIQSDVRVFGAEIIPGNKKNKITILTIVEVFYPDVRGFVFGKSFAKVRLNMTAVMEDKELLSKKYESFYITNGTDEEFEGSMMMTIEQGANVTIGMTLRKVLDQFYNDLKEKL